MSTTSVRTRPSPVLGLALMAMVVVLTGAALVTPVAAQSEPAPTTVPIPTTVPLPTTVPMPTTVARRPRVPPHGAHDHGAPHDGTDRRGRPDHRAGRAPGR